MRFNSVSIFATRIVFAFVALSLITGCASGPEKLKSKELPTPSGLVVARMAWTVKLGIVDFPLDIRVNGDTVAIASAEGLVASYNAVSGAEIWRVNVGSPIAAGVGSDGRFSSVVTRSNELIALDGGHEIWRKKLSAQTFTAPLVAGGRIFLLSADRSVSAFDIESGRKLWTQQRPGESLVLRQTGILLAVGDTLIAGISGRLLGFNPVNGSIRWDIPIASPRGTNDIERMVDLVGRAAREGNVLCVRAFQVAIGCVDAVRGSLLWTKVASGATGLNSDEKYVFGVETDSKIVAWRRTDGERAWLSDSFQFRNLTAPLVIGRSLAVGDDAGFVHLMSREDGAVLARVSTDGSAVITAPVLAGGTLVVVTRNGGVFGFRPE